MKKYFVATELVGVIAMIAGSIMKNEILHTGGWILMCVWCIYILMHEAESTKIERTCAVIILVCAVVIVLLKILE